MFPRSRQGESKHRQRLREREIARIVEILRPRLAGVKGAAGGKPRILEFGSGDGFQLPPLQQLGDVVGSDVHAAEVVKTRWRGRFVVCDVTEAAFGNGRFDVLFSNHVIEHLENVPAAFEQLKRVARPGALFAFSVPTRLWLLSAVPAQYYNKLRNLGRKLFGANAGDDTDAGPPVAGSPDASREASRGIAGRVVRFLLPVGHGVEERFIPCCRAFRVKAWRRFFEDAGFQVRSVHPLLLYGASEWPVVPTTGVFARFGVGSSVLFILSYATDLP